MSEFVKNDTYKELRPANVYDVAANETWLEDSAREGWHLVGFKGPNGLFVRGDARECRYRMKPLLKKEKAPDPEWVEIYRGLGWEYVTTLKGLFHVWRSDDPGAPELDTDPVVQGEGYSYLRRKMVRDFALGVLALLVMLGIWFWDWNNRQTPFLQVLERGLPLYPLVFCLLLVSIPVLEFQYIRTMRRLLRALRMGIPLERPRPYRGQKRLAQAAWGLLAVFWGLAIVNSLPSPMLGPAFTRDEGVGEESVPRQEAVYVDLRELDGAQEDDAGFLRTQSKICELAPRMYWTWQYADLPDSTKEYAYTSYYHLLTDKLSSALERDLLEYTTYVGKSEQDVETPMEVQSPGPLDSFWWRTADGWQTVVAVRGQNVLYLQYQGLTDLRTAGDYFAELLREN